MQKITELALGRVPWGFFTRAEAANWLGVSTAALDALLKRADEGVYEAKARGRNQVIARAA